MSNVLNGNIPETGLLKGSLLTLLARDGYSAYELAVKEGFVGTLEEWLVSLKGDPGVYLGSGDMPDGYNVQIDPNGDPVDALWIEMQASKIAAEEAARSAELAEAAAGSKAETAEAAASNAVKGAEAAEDSRKAAEEAETRTAALAEKAEASVAAGAYISFWMDNDGALWMDKTQNASEFNFYADEDGAVYVEVVAQ